MTVSPDSPNAENSPQDYATTSSPILNTELPVMVTPTPCGKQQNVWAVPWILMIIALYAFTLPWINFAIINRYFLKPDWGAALPGLDSTACRKFTMRAHMATGAISLVLGPLQFIRRLRNSYPKIHKWSGRIYCISAMASCLFGLVFIALKRRLAGGYNMSFAFAAAGVTVGVLSFKAWQTARAAKLGAIPDFTAHRNWGIRSYSQILAPMLYRYWYICVQLFNIYKAPVPPRLGGFCRSDGICPDYLRIFDMVHCWTYWLSALAVAELIIYYLPKHDNSFVEAIPDRSTETPSIDLVEPMPDSATETLYNEQDPHIPLLPRRRLSPSTDPNHTEEQHHSNGSPSVAIINVIGWVLAAITISITMRIYTYQGR